MSKERDKMIEALQKSAIPKLREMGFKGSFPHFRRASETRIDLLTFQFDKWGGGFIIEISQCPIAGITTHWGKRIAPDKVKAWDMYPDQRLRLHPRAGSSTAGSSTRDWFRYDKPQNGTFAEIAESVLPFLTKAEKWWSSQQLPKL